MRMIFDARAALMAAAIAMSGCVGMTSGRIGQQAAPEATLTDLHSDIGSMYSRLGIDATMEKDPENPLCYRITNVGKATKLVVVGGWLRAGTDEVVAEKEKEFTLRKGEILQFCPEIPANATGKIEYGGFYLIPD